MAEKRCPDITSQTSEVERATAWVVSDADGKAIDHSATPHAVQHILSPIVETPSSDR